MVLEHPSASTRISVRLAELAQEQRGVVAWHQLRALGYAEATIAALVRRGVLHRLWPGVYAVGHSVLTQDGWRMAAVLACGHGAVLCGRAAASAWGLLTPRSTVDVATPVARGITVPGIRAHRLALRPEERDVHRGIPVTSVARTALDVAAHDHPDRLGDLLDEALLHGLYDHGEVVELLGARRGCRGVGRLRLAVAQLGSEGVVFRSRPERVARDLIRDAGLPEPRVNAWFPTRAGHGYELDLWFPRLRRDLEIDGPHHALPHQRRKDELRDADLRSFGVDVLRVPADLVTDHPERFLVLARRFLERR